MAFVVVTGGNRGLGRAICKGVLRQSVSSRVVMCCRNDKVNFDGEEEKWASSGRLFVKKLDVTSEEEAAAAAEAVGKLTKPEKEELVLVNNAGIGEDLPWSLNKQPEAARRTIDTNLFGPERVTRLFLPLLKRHAKARVVHISSGAGTTNAARAAPAMQEVLTRDDLPWDEIKRMANTFIEEYQKEMQASPASMPKLSEAHGWWLQSYGFSKALLNCYYRSFAKQHPDVVVHGCCPGFCNTDMCKECRGTPAEARMKSPEEGVETPLFLISGGADDAKEAGFYKSKALSSWVTPPSS